MQTRRIFLYFVGSSAAAGLSACVSDPSQGEVDTQGEGTSDESGDEDESASSQEAGSATGDGDGDTGETGDCADPFEGGELLELMPFVGESGVVGQKTGAGTGHDARLALDLATITPETLITSNADFYIRTEFPDQLDESAPWSVRITGLVDADLDLPIETLLAMPHQSEVICLECSGNGGGARFGLMSAAEFSGVPLMDVLDMVDIDPSATMVVVGGFDAHTAVSTHSTPGASWAFTFDQIAQAGGMLVTAMNGEALPRDHGEPVRLMMPGWYGCCDAKWVDEIRLVDDTEPATAQMQEFASRTHQIGVPALAKDYIAATMDQCAMVTRVEKWRVDGQILYRLVGIMWGGYETTDKLVMEIAGVGSGPVEVCPAQSQNRTWTLWSVPFSPPEAGQYVFSMGIDDPAIETRRLDSGYYDRAVMLDEV